MIARMKKASIFVLSADAEGALRHLGALGVLHIADTPAPGGALSALEGEKAVLEKARQVLEAQEGFDPGDPPRAGTLEEGLALARRTLELVERQRGAEERAERLRQEEIRLAPWGDFDPSEISRMRAAGVEVTLHESSLEQFAALPADPAFFVVSRDRNAVRFAEARAGTAAAGFASRIPSVRPPEHSLTEIRRQIAEASGEKEGFRAELLDSTRSLPILGQALGILEARLEFERARASMGAEYGIRFLTGYVPEKSLPSLQDRARASGWGLLASDPEPGDDAVPTHLENPRWVRIIDPVIRFMGAVPGYREFDISFFFLLFFSVFFAMIVGDAAYGLIFSLGALFARILLPRLPPQPFILLFVLGLGAVVWGAMTGTWFGSEALSRIPLLARLVVPGIASFADQAVQAATANTVLRICFIIALSHLVIARFVNFLRSLPALKAYANLGWACMLIGMFFVVQNLVLKSALSPAAYPLAIAGFAVVAMFSEQDGRFLKGLGLGIAKMPLKILGAVGAFADIVSYARLFAVGLASLELAKTFNAMGAAAGAHFAPGGILILLLGHTLNIVLSMMSLLVHGVRLNMLEFCGHLEMEWTGSRYAPFRLDCEARQGSLPREKE